jgi:hypothetical protein
MIRVLIALALILVAAEVAEAGPIRARLAARRGCSSCQQPRGLAFRPAGTTTTAPAVSNSVTCAGGRCVPLAPFGTLPSGR